jgi:hypothetical protein
VGGVCVQSVLPCFLDVASQEGLKFRSWSLASIPLYRLDDEGVRFVSSITLQACAFMRSH